MLPETLHNDGLRWVVEAAAREGVGISPKPRNADSECSRAAMLRPATFAKVARASSTGNCAEKQLNSLSA